MLTGPTIKYPRSAFMQHKPVVTSWKHGEIVPIFSTLVLPGTTLSMNLGSLIRMNTPVAPFMGEIEAEINAFFVPMRLLWSKWKQMFGENENSAGVPSDISITLGDSSNANIFTSGVPWYSTSAYVGKPIVGADATKVAKATLWKEKAYYKVWSEHYRHTMIQGPFIMNDNPDRIGSIDGVTLATNAGLKKVNKTLDTFTGALQSPQFGSSVTLPLGDTAPVTFLGDNLLSNNAMTLMSAAKSPVDPQTKVADKFYLDNSGTGYDGKLVADLSQATAATINTIRYAFALQKYQELGNFGGAVYWGQLAAHYGVTPSDASLQRSQRLGTINFTLNMSQVTAMGDNTINGVKQPAGSVGGISVTGNNRHLFTKAFDEFGVVICLLHTRVKKQLYQQGLLREDTRLSKIDYFSPEFANVGDFKVYKKEIFVTGDSSDDEVFGYNEAWYDERYLVGSATGVCNAQAGAGVAVDIWSLANNFASRPQLNSSFITEDRDLVASRLITGTSSNFDYIGEFKIAIQKISEVPLHSLPGKIDHVGNM